MSTGTPVVVSRIQNRRGLKDDFLYLYPPGYNGVDGFGYIPSYTEENPQYQNILQPGELALCTDSRELFMGNVNGQYIKLNVDSSLEPENLILRPNSIVLQPTASYQPLSEDNYEFSPRPFLNILYDITDTVIDTGSAILPSAPNTTGVNFARSGQLTITATGTLATLSDNHTVINNYPLIPQPIIGPYPPDVDFKVEYNEGGNLLLKYKHNFPGPLTFTTSTIVWISII